MISPYQILGVSRQATDADIKQAYLQRVKDNPPDRDQQRFQQIQQAYETLKDGDSRLRYDLFQLPAADFDALLDQAFKPTRAFGPLSADEFCQLLQAMPVEKALEKVLTNT
jgi:DnaJ-class molecular chaperone